ncbi:hypothetical protein [Polaribacter sp.]|uniref:hypothetical protein n=1 Tax=Polaribacter sp. TaxID=1920175 RepID=UPI003F6BA746
MDIYMLKTDDLFNTFKDFNGFTLSEFNDLNELPKKLIKLLKKAKKYDMVYSLHNFMLDFNLEQKTTSNEEYMMFIPDEKFNLKIM